jgi:hypothetical protein
VDDDRADAAADVARPEPRPARRLDARHRLLGLGRSLRALADDGPRARLDRHLLRLPPRAQQRAFGDVAVLVNHVEHAPAHVFARLIGPLLGFPLHPRPRLTPHPSLKLAPRLAPRLTLRFPLRLAPRLRPAGRGREA